MRVYLSCRIHQELLGSSDQGNEVYRTNNEHMRDKNFVQNFSWKPWWLMPVGKPRYKWKEYVTLDNNNSVWNQTIQPYTRSWRAIRELITILDIQRKYVFNLSLLVWVLERKMKRRLIRSGCCLRSVSTLTFQPVTQFSWITAVVCPHCLFHCHLHRRHTDCHQHDSHFIYFNFSIQWITSASIAHLAFWPVSYRTLL
jgi:hypothetical protein